MGRKQTLADGPLTATSPARVAFSISQPKREDGDVPAYELAAPDVNMLDTHTTGRFWFR